MHALTNNPTRKLSENHQDTKTQRLRCIWNVVIQYDSSSLRALLVTSQTGSHLDFVHLVDKTGKAGYASLILNRQEEVSHARPARCHYTDSAAL
jgi:hypothetical protein